jgi:hypothetical protein
MKLIDPGHAVGPAQRGRSKGHAQRPIRVRERLAAARRTAVAGLDMPGNG